MKCQFCNQRCRLLRRNEPDFNEYNMIWLCERHPVRVSHIVSISNICLRRNRSITGTIRTWTRTVLNWENERKQCFMAYFNRYEEDEEFSLEIYRKNDDTTTPDKDFLNYYFDSIKVFEMDPAPKEITPENIAHKVEYLAIFS